MSRWRCDGCATAYALRLTRCPRCHTTTFREETVMPKISRHAGATNAGAAAPNPPASAAAPDQTEEAAVLWHCLDCTTAYAVGAPACPHCGSERHADEPTVEPAPTPAVPEPVAAPVLPDVTEEGGEPPSPGNSSSPSMPKPQTSSAPSKPSRPPRARKTANRSPKDRTGASSAPSTAGSGTAPAEPDAEQPDDGEDESEGQS